MPITKTLNKSSPNRLVYLITGDGAATSLTIDSAALITDAVAGPLEDLLSASYANQAAMRSVFGGGNVELLVQVRAATNSNIVSAQVDVDVDAVTAARPEVNLTFVAAPANGDTAYLVIENKHSIVQ
jgi:hypothetical protein